jgi:hypothetical protein
MSNNLSADQPQTPPAPQFVWRSTKESVLIGIPSALAVAEIIAAISAYWFVAIFFGTFAQLWISISVAPLLLLRSEASIELGRKWFEAYVARDKDYPASELFNWKGIWIFALFEIVIAVGIITAMNHYWIIQYSNWSAIWRASIVGIIASQAVAVVGGAFFGLANGLVLSLLGQAGTFIALIIMAIFPAVNPPSTLLSCAGGLAIFSILGHVFIFFGIKSEGGSEGLILTPGLGIGVWLTSLAIRFAATAVYLKSGVAALPKNFRQTVFVIDSRWPALLMPGYESQQLFTSNGLWRRFRHYSGLRDKSFMLIILLIFCLPAFAYRLSIKSTCWLYLPLVYITGGRYSSFKTNYLVDRLSRSPWERIRRALACLTLFGFFIITLAHNFGKLPQIISLKSVSPLEFLFLLDFHFWTKPWQICNLAGALITFYLIGAAGHARVDLSHTNDPQVSNALVKQTEVMKLLMRCRDIFSALLVTMLFVHALLLFSPIMAYLPDNVIQVLGLFYGAYMPSYP